MLSKHIPHIRWKLVFYDLIIYLLSIYIFFIHYHGGGILYGLDTWYQVALSFLCIFSVRFLGSVYSQIWRYGGVQTYMRLILCDIVGATLYGSLNLILRVAIISTSRVISVVTINMLGALIMRMAYRYCYKCGNDQSRLGRLMILMLKLFAGNDVTVQRDAIRQRHKIAIVGAGRVGVSLAEDLLNNSQATAVPVCFIDIKPEKIGREIHGIRVLNQARITAEVLHDYDVDEVVFAVPIMDADEKRNLYEHFRKMGFPVKIYDFPVMRTGGKRQLRNFEVEEVLFRAPVIVTDENTGAYYKDKVILVTGGGGSIGSELARQVAAMQPKTLILLDIYENGVYEVQQELIRRFGRDIDLHVEICSITDKVSLSSVFQQYHPQIVIHAAAHKHVPLMEHNCVEAVTNNVFGTENVVELCEEYNVDRFMALSTDKAVNPTNVMGATKRMCEFIMQAHSTSGHCRYSATRFGNVLGSAGSVIPLFKRQIAEGGPITITDKRIIRYFMTIPEASQLVLQSGAMAQNGELFVLDMGKPVKILDLAENMIRLSGLEPYQDIDIIETGLRPGEKLYEELLVRSEELDKTPNELIFIERDKPISMDELEDKLDRLRSACASHDNDRVREMLRSVVPTFKRPEEVNNRVIE